MKLLHLLNRLKWDSKYDFNRVRVWYEDRAGGEMACLKGEEIVSIGEKFLETSRGYIPVHRIRKIEYEGEVLWNSVSSS